MVATVTGESALPVLISVLNNDHARQYGISPVLTQSPCLLKDLKTISVTRNATFTINSFGINQEGESSVLLISSSVLRKICDGKCIYSVKSLFYLLAICEKTGFHLMI